MTGRAALLAGLSALLGGGLALFANRHPAVLERTRTFAFAAAASVVAFHLLPEVLPSEGLAAFFWMGAGFVLPWLLEAGARTFGPGILERRGFSGMRVAAEVGFVALIFHSMVEGLALVAALSRPEGQVDLEIALVAHHAPLTAAVVLPFLDLCSARSAAVRALLVGAAGVLGAALSNALPGLGEGVLLQRATAVTAGALLHVVFDEIRAQRFASAWERALDVGACAAGLLVAGLGAVLHLRGGESSAAALQFLRALCGMALAMAPALLAGALAGALLAHKARRFRWDAFLVLLALLGPAASMAVTGLWLAFTFALARSDAASSPRPIGLELIEEVRERAPPILALVIGAAGLEVGARAFPAGAISVAALVALIALCARLDEAGAAAVAAVLVNKGLDPGLAVAALAFGPITRIAPLRASFALIGALLISLGGAVALSRAGALSSAHPAAQRALSMLRDPLGVQASATPFGVACAAVLLLLGVGTLWSRGVRGWFAPLRHGPGAA